MSEEEKIIEYLKKQYGDFDNYVRDLLDLYQKEKDLNQELQIRYKIENDKYKEEKEKNSKAIAHIKACRTNLENYILFPSEIEYLLELLEED